MDYISVPGISDNVSKIAFGAGNVDFENKQENIALINKFLENGGNLFDTANIYGKWLSSGSNESEIILGELFYKLIKIDKQIKREDIIISTKGGHPDLSTMEISRFSQYELRADLDESMKALKTDYIDIYYLHRDAPELPVDEILYPVLKFIEEGRIIKFGLSNWTNDRVLQAQKFLEDCGSHSLFGIQNRWSYARMNPEGSEDITLVPMTLEEYNWHIDTKLFAMPYSAIAKGYFSKLEKSDKQNIDKKLLRYYDNPLNDKRMNALKEISLETGNSISQIALAFLMNHEFLVFPIVRFRNESQLDDAVAATHIKLDERQMNILKQGSEF